MGNTLYGVVHCLVIQFAVTYLSQSIDEQNQHSEWHDTRHGRLSQILKTMIANRLKCLVVQTFWRMVVTQIVKLVKFTQRVNVSKMSNWIFGQTTPVNCHSSETVHCLLPCSHVRTQVFTRNVGRKCQWQNCTYREREWARVVNYYTSNITEYNYSEANTDMYAISVFWAT